MFLLEFFDDQLCNPVYTTNCWNDEQIISNAYLSVLSDITLKSAVLKRIAEIRPNDILGSKIVQLPVKKLVMVLNFQIA